MNLIVAVDGGASRCRLAAYTQAGDLLERIVVEDHASLSLGVSSAWQHIDQGLRILQRKLGELPGWQPGVLSMGLAGSLQQRHRHEFLKCIPEKIQTHLFTDGYAQLIGASEGKAGICLAVGTGSVMHWLDDKGNTGMAGGWGFPVGDQGSGAWLGMRLLQRLIAHRDGHTCNSRIINSVEKRVGSSVSAIQEWTTESRSSVLAQLAPLIFDAASDDDHFAQSLINEAAECCLELVRLAPGNLPVFVVGGVGAQLVPTLTVPLGSRLHRARGDALRGLWHLAVTK